MKPEILTTILLASGFFTLFLAGLAVKHLPGRGVWSFIAVLLCSSVYSIGYGMEISSVTLDDILFWSNIQYLGISFFPAFYIIMCLKYTGRIPRNYRFIIPLLFVIPVITLIMHNTSTQHNLFYINPAIDYNGLFPILSFQKGPLYIIHLTFINISLITGVIILTDFIRKAPAIYKKQGYLMLLGYMFPWLGFIMYISDIIPWRIDITPLTLTIASPIWAFAMLRYQLFNLLPVARDYIYESLTDGIIIIDHDKRIVDFNSSAAKIFPQLAKNRIGHTVTDVLGEHSLLMSMILNKAQSGLDENTLMINESYFKTGITPLYNRRSREEGRIISLVNITNQVLMFEEMKKLASTDSLTGIYNRRNFFELAGKEVEKCERYNRPLSLIILDIDHFKKINDTYGHITGDSAIKHIVKIINDGIRSVDIFCRYGGEEFALLLPETEPDSGYKTAERLCRALANSLFFTGADKITITASFGVSGRYPGNENNLDKMLQNADAALYEAKRSGRNRVKIIK